MPIKLFLLATSHLTYQFNCKTAVGFCTDEDFQCLHYCYALNFNIFMNIYWNLTMMETLKGLTYKKLYTSFAININ